MENDKKITLDLIEKDYNEAIRILYQRRDSEQNLKDKYLIEKLEQSLRILRLEIANGEDTYALDLLNKVTQAVAKSKSLRETAIVLDRILRDDKTTATGEIKALHEVAEALLGKEDEISALRRQIKGIQKNRDKDQKQATIAYIIVTVIALVGLIAFVVQFL